MEPTATPQTVTGIPALDHALTIIGALVPLLSAVASFVNHRVRQKTEAGFLPDSKLLAVGSILNVASVNFDKAMQLARLMAAAATNGTNGTAGSTNPHDPGAK